MNRTCLHAPDASIDRAAPGAVPGEGADLLLVASAGNRDATIAKAQCFVAGTTSLFSTDATNPAESSRLKP